MSYKVKVSMVGFLGNTQKYPCHFQHKPGDHVIFDGEKFDGRMCSSVWPLVMPIVSAVHMVGPSWKSPAHYYPFWYAPLSVDDPDMKKCDGIGFRNVLETAVEPQYHMANMQPKGAFVWPPVEDKTILSTPTVICGDTRTAAMFKIEAIDLADGGYHVPYYRRQMVILHKVLTDPGTPEEKILGLFSRDENEGIYPALSNVMIRALDDELEFMGYIERKDEKVTVTDKGKKKLEAFKAGLPPQDREALKL
jgi:uncharacterized repeat protein (TIGR04076 family)